MADSCGCLTKTQYCKAIILQLKINKLKRKELRNLKAGSLSRLRFSPGRGEYGCTATANLLVAKKKKNLLVDMGWSNTWRVLVMAEPWGLPRWTSQVNVTICPEDWKKGIVLLLTLPFSSSSLCWRSRAVYRVQSSLNHNARRRSAALETKVYKLITGTPLIYRSCRKVIC